MKWIAVVALGGFASVSFAPPVVLSVDDRFGTLRTTMADYRDILAQEKLAKTDQESAMLATKRHQYETEAVIQSTELEKAVLEEMRENGDGLAPEIRFRTIKISYAYSASHSVRDLMLTKSVIFGADKATKKPASIDQWKKGNEEYVASLLAAFDAAVKAWQKIP